MEAMEHPFFYYAKVCMFWDDLKVEINSVNIYFKDILFGFWII